MPGCNTAAAAAASNNAITTTTTNIGSNIGNNIGNSNIGSNNSNVNGNKNNNGNNNSDAEAKRDVEAGSDNDSEICDLAIDGAVEDEVLKKSAALTQQEVVRRRNRRVKQLMKLYRLQYWGLLEELRSKYRVFYIKHGRGGWRDEAESEKEKGMLENGEKDAKMEVEVVVVAAADGNEKHARGNDSVVKEMCANGNENVLMKGNEALVKNGGIVGGMTREPLAPERKSTGENNRCSNQGCKSKPMGLASYCFSHILLDPRQQLYRPCSFVTRSGQSGTLTCGKPVLRSLVPLYCPAHIQKQLTRGVRKTNSNVSTATAKMARPKLHLVIAEYVRLIQAKRRAARESALKHASGSIPSVKDGNSGTTPPSCMKID